MRLALGLLLPYMMTRDHKYLRAVARNKIHLVILHNLNQ